MTIQERYRKMGKTAAGVAVAAGVAAGSLLLGNAPAFADATGCAGNTCMYLAGNPGAALVQGWARNSTFYGHFHLSGPGVSKDSPTQNWYGRKGNYWPVNIPSAKAGRYCVGGYATNGTYEGTACETLS